MILGVLEGVVKYIGGYENVMVMVFILDKVMNISVLVVVYLDYGIYEGVFKVICVGFILVMFDGLYYLFEENLKKI